MTAPPPDPQFLASQLRWARGRGIPLQEAEDIVFDAYHVAAASYDPQRGDFPAYMHTVVRNACAGWWRRQQVTERAHAHLRLVPRPDADREARAAHCQAQILDALSAEERAVFAAWALQKQLGKGQVTSDDVAHSLGMGRTAYENAKRRLKARLQRLLDEHGWSAATVLYGEDDVERTG